MSLTMLVSLIGPLAVKFLSGLVDRFWNNGLSTLKGAGVGAAVIGGMEMLGCDMALGDEAIIGAIAALPHLLGKDADSASQSILASMKERIDQAKRSKQVLAEAEAAQKKAAEDAGIHQ